MNEKELNTIMSVVTNPIENVYKMESHKDYEEITRIVRILDMAHEQHIKHTMLSVRSLLALKLVMSNN